MKKNCEPGEWPEFRWWSERAGGQAQYEEKRRWTLQLKQKLLFLTIILRH
jgi:hypothetical protein